jgi:hypothetical protein
MIQVDCHVECNPLTAQAKIYTDLMSRIEVVQHLHAFLLDVHGYITGINLIYSYILCKYSLYMLSIYYVYTMYVKYINTVYSYVVYTMNIPGIKLPYHHLTGICMVYTCYIHVIFQ